MKEAGSEIFEDKFELFGNEVYSYDKDFSIPSSLLDYLSSYKHTKVTEDTRILNCRYRMYENKDELQSAGVTGSLLGNSGDLISNIVNSSMVNDYSSGNNAGFSTNNNYDKPK